MCTEILAATVIRTDILIMGSQTLSLIQTMSPQDIHLFSESRTIIPCRDRAWEEGKMADVGIAGASCFIRSSLGVLVSVLEVNVTVVEIII